MAVFQGENGVLQMGSKTPVSILQELLLRNNIVPQYDLIHNGVGTHDPEFRYQLKAGSFLAIGCGKSKKEAKHDAARSILRRMQSSKALTEAVNVPHVEDIDIASPYTGALKENLVGMLNELCCINKLPAPEYIPMGEEGPPHARIFTMQCNVSKSSEVAVARTKKQAKHMVAQQMINRVMHIRGDRLIPLPDKSTEGEDEVTDLLMIESGRLCQVDLGLKIADYHNVFQDETKEMPSLAALIDLGEKSIEWLETHEDPEALLGDLLKQLDCRIKILQVTKESLMEEVVNVQEHVELLSLSENKSDEEVTLLPAQKCELGVLEKVFLSIEGCHSAWTFWGKGNSVKHAHQNASLQALKFFHLMSKGS